MASKKDAKKSDVQQTGPAMPEGFQKVNNEQSNAWVRPDEGVIVSEPPGFY